MQSAQFSFQAHLGKRRTRYLRANDVTARPPVWPNQADCRTKQAADVCMRLCEHSLALRSFCRVDGICPGISLVIEQFDLFSREFLEGPLPPRERMFKPFLWKVLT